MTSIFCSRSDCCRWKGQTYADRLKEASNSTENLFIKCLNTVIQNEYNMKLLQYIFVHWFINVRQRRRIIFVCICSFLFLFFLLLRRSKVQTQSKQTKKKIQSLTCRGRLGDLKQHCARLHVPDLEPGEVNAVNVFIWAAQIIWREDCDTDKTREVEKSEGGENTTNIKARPADKYAKILRYDDDTLNKNT